MVMKETRCIYLSRLDTIFLPHRSRNLLFVIFLCCSFGVPRSHPHFNTYFERGRERDKKMNKKDIVEKINYCCMQDYKCSVFAYSPSPHHFCRFQCVHTFYTRKVNKVQKSGFHSHTHKQKKERKKYLNENEMLYRITRKMSFVLQNLCAQNHPEKENANRKKSEKCFSACVYIFYTLSFHKSGKVVELTDSCRKEMGGRAPH